MTEKTNSGNAGGHNALLKQALRAVEQMKQKLDDAAARPHQPIAIIGMGCRFPGDANDARSFWELLKHGREALTTVPPDRWNIDEYYDPDPSKPGKMVSRVGGFLTGVDLFDAAFFGIAPREAAMMDPQQRLLLEVVWEALENAGIAPRSLAGSRVGMYLGMASGDYAQMQLHAGDASLLDVHFASGNAHSVASGRLSYLLGLKGPSLSVDTACSSSLVAVHLACQALRASECAMAIAGGVNVILAPETTVALSQAQMMSLDGRCRAFDDRANGFVRAEGCGVIVLKVLDKAQADGDPILAVIRGTALNQDGASSSLTVPNGPSQEDLMRRALEDADRTAAQVGYVEAHGTGTSLGDPIELRALGSVYGGSRKAAEPVLVGSLKTNFGHMEAAAGIGGLIKLVLALQHGEVPAHLHFETPTTHVPWDEIRLAVPRSTMAWPDLRNATRELTPRVGAVSSFGFSGTNAHLIVEQAPTTQRPAPAAVVQDGVAAAHVLPLSASSSDALRAVIERYERWLISPDAGDYDWGEIAATAATGRDHFRHRAALVASSKEEAVASLRSLNVASDLGTAIPPSICFLFTGQGSEHSGMGLDLLNHSAVFRAAVERLERALDGSLPDSIAAIWANGQSELEQASLVQPALYAYGWALSEFWRGCGVEPQVVLGHSLGEYVAATVAGVMTPEEGIRLVAARGRLTQDLGAAGGMIAIVAGEEEVRKMLATTGLHSALSFAAVNGPLSVVVSGGSEAIQHFEQNLRGTGIRHRRLSTTHGFHSAALDGVLDAFEAEAATVAFRVPDIRWISNVTGQAVDRKRPPDAHYWRQHLRQTVEFQRGLSAANLVNAGLFLEVGAEPQLLALAEANGIVPARCVPSISKRVAGGEWPKLLSAVGQLYTRGVDIDWKGLNEGRRFRRVPLPTYSFQRQRFWFTQRPRENVSAGVSATPAGHFPTQHPLLGARLRTRSESATFHAKLTPSYPAHLGDHVVQGRRMLPGAAYLEVALAAARQVTGQTHWKAVDVEFREPCFFDEPRLLETLVSAVDPVSGRRQFEIASTPLQIQEAQSGETGNWTVHAVGILEQAISSAPVGVPLDLGAIKSRATRVLQKDAFYGRFKAAGLDFGAVFQPIREAWSDRDEGLIALELAPEVIAESAAYGIHPIALDACLQAAAVLIDADASASPALPAALSSFHCQVDPNLPSFAHVKVRKREGLRLSVDIQAMDANGNCLLVAEGLRLMPSSGQQYRGWLHRVEWEPISLTGESSGEQTESLHLALVSLDSNPLQKELRIPAEQNRLAEFESWTRDFDLLCSAWIAHAFEQGGFDLTPGREFSLNDLLRHFSVAPQHHRLAYRFLVILWEAEYLESLGSNHFRVLKRTYVDIASTAARLRAANHPEMNWTEQTVAQLVPLLRGEVSPLNLLFSVVGKQIATRLYRESVVARTLNPIITAAAVQVAVQLNRKVRVLEVGGGTAATTSYLLPELRGRIQEYVWTDIGATFVSAARLEFASVEGMRFQTLNVERNPAEQGFAGERFDIVIASNVIHATADLKQTLNHIRSLLSPGGALLMAETTRKQPWIDLTVGFTEGWWRFSDRDLRPDYALIGKQAWSLLLRESGFSDVLLLPDLDKGILSGQCVIAAVNGPQESRAGAAQPPLTAEVSVLIITSGSVAEPGPLASSLTQEAKSRGAVVTLISTTEIDQASIDAWFVHPPGRRGASSRSGHIFYLPAAELATPSAESTGIDALNWQMEVLGGALACTQAMLSGDHFTGCRLWLVSSGASGPEIISPDGATMAAFARSLRGEFPEVCATAVDLPANDDSARELWLLAHEVSDTAMQVALRGGRAWVPRLTPYALPQDGTDKANKGRILGQFDTRRLRFVPSGLLEDLELVKEGRRAPTSDEVEIAIGAAPINFHEVLSALEPGSAHDLPPGGECAGVIIRVGDQVSGLQTGDRVVAIGSGLMAEFATLPRNHVWKIPSGMSEEDSATLLIPFLTARWSLGRVARLQPGERVLIHAGAGGVGLAAIQEAKRLGTVVYATAGNDAKREYLRSLGVEGVFDSRSGSFEFGVFEATGFRGVDVVLNSLSGDKIAAGMRCLAPRGRFIELGERTVLSDGEAKALRPDVSYHRVHLRAALQAAVPEVRDIIASILSDVAAGKISPLPWKRFALEDAAAAFRYMAASQHTGRVLLAPSNSTSNFTVRRDGAYVVSGAFSGLGRLTVEWLAERGAGCVLALARGEPDAKTAQLFAELRQKGTQIVAMRCDVSDEASLGAAIDTVPAAFALRGVFHAAGVLDDASLPQQKPSRFSAVLAPKVAGAWNLHRLTLSAKLDCFVLFSSAAGVFGSRGQSNHAAANAYLDALAHYRRERLGLTALSVNWGAWSGTGAAVRHNVVERVERIGVHSIPPAEGFKILERLLGENCTQVLVSRVDWARWAQHERAEAAANADLLVRVLHEPSRGNAEKNGSPTGSHQAATVIAPNRHRSWRSALQAAPETQQLSMLEARVEERVRAVLCFHASQSIDATRPLQEYGLDSLLSIELRNALSSDLEAKLAATTLFDYPTLASLTKYLFHDVLDIRTNEEAAHNGQTPKQDVIGTVASLSDDEVERLFQGKMAEI